MFAECLRLIVPFFQSLLCFRFARILACSSAVHVCVCVCVSFARTRFVRNDRRSGPSSSVLIIDMLEMCGCSGARRVFADVEEQKTETTDMSWLEEMLSSPPLRRRFFRNTHFCVHHQLFCIKVIFHWVAAIFLIAIVIDYSCFESPLRSALNSLAFAVFLSVSAEFPRDESGKKPHSSSHTKASLNGEMEFLAILAIR